MRFYTFATALAVVPCVLAQGLKPAHRPSPGKPSSGDFKSSINIKKVIDNKVSEKKPEEKKVSSENKPPSLPIITEEIVCNFFEEAEDLADDIFDIAEPLEPCDGTKGYCWQPVLTAIYDLEAKIDEFDNVLDGSNLDVPFSERDEKKIVGCFNQYAESLIAAVQLIAHQIDGLDGFTGYYLVTATNSLRDADYTTVYGLVRRLKFDERAAEIMKKHGALDGSTPRSVREAFSRLVSTPYITGDEFKVEKGHGPKPPKPDDFKIIDEIKHKNKGCLKPKKHHKPGPRKSVLHKITPKGQ